MNDDNAFLLESFREILAVLVRFESVSRVSTGGILDWIRSYLEKRGIPSESFPVGYDSSLHNLYARIGENPEGGICFSGHLDVVAARLEGWSSPPFELNERSGRLYGRGTADMKGFLALILALLPFWKERGVKIPIHLCITCDEEIGCKGVPWLTRELQSRGIRPDAVILGEPTGCIPVHGHKGGAQCTTTVTGIAGHGSNPDLGVNALYHALDSIQILRERQEAIKRESRREGGFIPPWTTVSVGKMEGGTSRNTIPDLCRFLWEVRVLPEEEPEALVRELDGRMQSLLPRGTISPGLETVIESSYPGLIPREDSAALEWVRLADCMDPPRVVSFGTEAGHYSRWGIPAVVWGPGFIEQAHQTDEYLEWEQAVTYLGYLRNLETVF